jgi:hypothetical protein
MPLGRAAPPVATPNSNCPPGARSVNNFKKALRRWEHRIGERSGQTGGETAIGGEPLSVPIFDHNR